MKDIDIIILHYGNILTTQQCVSSLEENCSTYRNIIIVNNDPHISIEKYISKAKNKILINTKENIGFAKGVNLGIEKALEQNADYVVLLNNDTKVIDDFLLPLLSCFEKNTSVGITSPIIKFTINNKILYDHGGEINKMTGTTNHNNRKEISNKRELYVTFVSGCCMMIKREVLKKIGKFDESYFMYYEDVDFCLRAKDHGFKIVIIPTAIIMHDLSNAIGHNSLSKIYHLTKSRSYFARTHTSFPFRYFSLIIQSLKFFLKDPRRFFVLRDALLSR